MSEDDEKQRLLALGYVRQTRALAWRARDLLTEVGYQGESGEMAAVLRILEDVSALLEARNADALRRAGGGGPMTTEALQEGGSDGR